MRRKIFDNLRNMAMLVNFQFLKQPQTLLYIHGRLIELRCNGIQIFYKVCTDNTRENLENHYFLCGTHFSVISKQ